MGADVLAVLKTLRGTGACGLVSFQLLERVFSEQFEVENADQGNEDKLLMRARTTELASYESTTPTRGGGLRRPYKGLSYLKSLPWFSSLSNLSWLRMYSLTTSSFLPTVLM